MALAKADMVFWSFMFHVALFMSATPALSLRLDDDGQQQSQVQATKKNSSNSSNSSNSTPAEAGSAEPEEPQNIAKGCPASVEGVAWKSGGAIVGLIKKAAVRCCSKDGKTCTSNARAEFSGPSDSAAGCKDHVTWNDANHHCCSHGMRLCTQPELNDGICCNTGCSFDAKVVWSAPSKDVCPKEESLPVNIPSNGTGGRIIKNVGCSKDLRKTLHVMGADEDEFTVFECQEVAKHDTDCGKTVYTDGRACICAIKGRKCDIINVPGSTMFIPTTTTAPNPLRPPPPQATTATTTYTCGHPMQCSGPKGGSWVATTTGDIPGTPYALGHTGNVDDCHQKCCQDKICEAIKYSPLGKHGGLDNCALYSNISLYDRDKPMDRDFAVHLLKRRTLKLGCPKFDMIEAWEAREKLDAAKKAEKAISQASKDLETAAEVRESILNGSS